MNLEKEKTIVCLATCTRGRPQSVERLLESYLALQVPEELELMVLIVENDEQDHLRSILQASATKLPFTFHYFWESRLGIPIARNRCLREAKALGADYLVFIDDKEHASPQWVEAYWQFAQSLSGPAFVEGCVQAEFPAEAPDHLKPFFQREVRATGAEILSCTTANVWMPLALVEQYGLSFDESQPFAGGTDTKLFTHAREQGASLYYCAEALVYESLPIGRFNRQWLAQRQYRCGVTEGELQQAKGVSVNQYVRKRLPKVISSAFNVLLYSVLFSKQKTLKYYLKVFRKWGEIRGALGHRVDSYQSVDGK